MWTRSGNFASIYTPSGRISKFVTYINRMTDANITELSLYGYSDGGIQIMATMKNAAVHYNLQQSMLRANVCAFYVHTLVSYTLLITTPEETIRNFERMLNVINTFSNLEEIHTDIRRNIGKAIRLNNYRHNVASRSVTRREQHPRDVDQLLNLANSMFNNPTVTELYNEVMTSIWHRLSLPPATAATITPMPSMIRTPRTTTEPVSGPMFAPNIATAPMPRAEQTSIPEQATNTEQAPIPAQAPRQVNIYDTLAAVQREIYEIRRHRQHNNQYLLNANGQLLFSPSMATLSRRGIFSQLNFIPDIGIDALLNASLYDTSSAAPIPLPAAGENAASLEAANFSGDIPEKYICKLSGNIMTNPVHDAAHIDIKFEEAWLLRALDTKQENPFTKTRLTKENVVADVALKTKIANYVKETIAALNKPSDASSHPQPR